MPRTWIRAIVATAVVAFIAAAAMHTALARDLTQEGAKARTVLDGVYSDAQAARGKERYAKECASCHVADLSGSAEAPPLNGDAFIVQWERRSVNDLFSSIRDTMPQGTPGQLSGTAYAEIVAYLLQANAYPPGAEELSRDADLLKTIQIVRRKP